MSLAILKLSATLPKEQSHGGQIRATIEEQKVFLKLLRMNAKHLSPSYKPKRHELEANFELSFLLPLGHFLATILGCLHTILDVLSVEMIQRRDVLVVWRKHIVQKVIVRTSASFSCLLLAIRMSAYRLAISQAHV